MDLAQAFNAPEVLDLGGRTFPVRQLQLKEWAELQAWLKRAVPSPVTQALRTLQEADDFGIVTSERTRKELLDHAQELAKGWPPAVGTRAWLRALDAAEGGTALFVRTVLAKGGTALTEAEALELYGRATEAEVNDLVRVAYFGDPPAPKPPTPTDTVTTPSTAGTPATTGPSSSTG